MTLEQTPKDQIDNYPCGCRFIASSRPDAPSLDFNFCEQHRIEPVVEHLFSVIVALKQSMAELRVDLI